MLHIHKYRYAHTIHALTVDKHTSEQTHTWYEIEFVGRVLLFSISVGVCCAWCILAVSDDLYMGETRALRRRPSVAENKQGRGTDKVVFRLQASSLAWGQSFHIVGVNSDTHLDCCLTEMLFLMSQIEGKTANNRRRAPNDKTVLLKKKKILLSARLNNRWRSRPAGFWIYRAVTEVLSPHKDAVYSTEASERKKKNIFWPNKVNEA